MDRLQEELRNKPGRFDLELQNASFIRRLHLDPGCRFLGKGKTDLSLGRKERRALLKCDLGGDFSQIWIIGALR